MNVIICVAKDNSAIVASVLPINGEEKKLLLKMAVMSYITKF